MPGLFDPLAIRELTRFRTGFHLRRRLRRDKPARQAFPRGSLNAFPEV